MNAKERRERDDRMCEEINAVLDWLTSDCNKTWQEIGAATSKISIAMEKAGRREPDAL